MKRNTCVTKRLSIRPLRAADYKVWFDRDPYPAKECSEKKFKFNLKKYRRMAKADTTYVWGIFEKKSGSLVGILDISIIKRNSLQVANLAFTQHNVKTGVFLYYIQANN